MALNILRALINIVQNPVYKLLDYSKSHNRANNMGGALEEYIKDAFAGTIGEENIEIRNRVLSHCFSYLGNQNNPPDSMLFGGDAIEVKKVENANSNIALNSSYPKNKLYSNSTMITAQCRNCEPWTEKDIIYAIGVCKNNLLSSLSFVYGIDYAASPEIYNRIKNTIIDGVNTIPDIELAETNELGRVNRVDPLGITNLRVRGMWGIQNPKKVFEYIYKPTPNSNFNLMAIINTEKYYSFPDEDRNGLEGLTNIINISDVKIKEPDNPARLKEAKLITFAK